MKTAAAVLFAAVTTLSWTIGPVTSTCGNVYTLFQLHNSSSFTYYNETRVSTGRVEVCINGTSYPVCANGFNITMGVIPFTNICRIVTADSSELPIIEMLHNNYLY